LEKKLTNLREKRRKWGEILENYLADFVKTAKAKKSWKIQVEKQIRTIKIYHRVQAI